jgi:lipoate-protein ligase A
MASLSFFWFSLAPFAFSSDMRFTSLDVAFPDAAFDGPMQMAIDEALLETVSRPLLRFYRWTEPTATFGYFQLVAEARGAAGDLPLTRRWTGGGVVLHGRDLTFSLVVPGDDPFCLLRPRDSYRAIHSAIACALGDAIAGIRMANQSDESTGVSCFANPTLHDLVTPAGKLAGGAQRRTRRGILHQGSIQSGSDSPLSIDAISGAFAADIQTTRLTADVLAAAGALAESRYATNAWLSRR